MSICLSCNKPLSEEEQNLVYEWGEEIELCELCLEDSEVECILNRHDLEGQLFHVVPTTNKIKENYV